MRSVRCSCFRLAADFVLPQCMVRRLTAREKLMAKRQVCANVFVNRGEDVVKSEDLPPLQ